MQTLTGSLDSDVDVSEVVLVGPGDPLPDNPCALLICTEPERLDDAVTAAGVVVKLHGRDPGAWTGLPFAVLAADDSLPWHHLLHLLTTAAHPGGSPGAVGDLFALANSIAAMVGGAVSIEDVRRRVLAYSSLPDQPIDEARKLGILGRQVPDLLGNDRSYQEMQRSSGVVRIPGNGDVLSRLAVAVRASAELLGSIWVVENEPLPPEAQQALLESSRLAALHLLRARAGSDVERRGRGELLRALIDGRATPAGVAARLGIDGSKPVAMLGFSLPEQVASDELGAEAVADLVQLQCSAVSSRSSVLVRLRVIYALVPVAELPRARLVQLASAAVERAKAAMRVELRAAIGATVPSLRDVARSLQDVEAVLQLSNAACVAAIEDVLPQVALLDLQAHLAGTPHLRIPAVTRMLDHDAENGTSYAASVLALLATAEVPLAAAAVNVHPNTFRYRLRRVRELFDLDLDDPDVRLMTWLYLRARP